MATFAINAGQPYSETVEADYFKTEGDFVDFLARADDGRDDVVFRMAAKLVLKVEKKK